MSVQYPIIPIATNPVGIDAVVIDLQGLLNSNLSWLSDGLGRAYKMNKVRSNGAAQILPLVYLGTSNYTYFSAQPDNDKQGQNFILVGDGLHINQQQGFYSILEYDISIIFSVNLKLINAPLLLTEDFTQNLIAQVREVLLRQTLGKPYNIGQITETRLFGDVYSEFDILDDSPNTGKAMTEMAYFRFNFSTQIKETCPVPVLPSITCFSMDLDGVNEYIQAPINTAFDLVRTDSMSFECWVKFDSFKLIDHLIAKYQIGKGIVFAVFNNELRFDLQNNSSTNRITKYSTGAVITTGVWYHFAVTYDGSENASGVKMFKNGVQLSDGLTVDTLTGSIINTESVKIGAFASAGFYSNALFNFARWWKTELTPAEILTQYNSGAPLTNAVRFSDLILECNSGNGATWNGSEFDILDATGITAGYTTVNAEEADKIEDCPT